MILNENIVSEIKELKDKLTAEGKLISLSKLKEYYNNFRKRFGPELLKNIDGEELLETIHGQGNKDSLVYWLEFKNDEEFPNKYFGGIGGGSSLKYGVFYSKDSRAWIKGGKLIKISLDEAINIARKQRDQLIKGIELLSNVSENANEEDYKELQNNMNTFAPDVSNLMWGHKYFNLLFPEILDSYHIEKYQRFHLIKLLQTPPANEGRYISAYKFVAIARELELSMNHLTTILGSRNGYPYRYWRIGTGDGTKPRNRWELMKVGSFVAIGWPALGNLQGMAHDQNSKNKLRELMEKHYPQIPQQIGKKTQQVFNFLTSINKGDIVIAMDGAVILGIGKVVGEYIFDPSTDFPHHLPVEWLSLKEDKLNYPEGLRTTVHELKDNFENLIEIEKHILISSTKKRAPQLPELGCIEKRIELILERKKQVILYGPPGTGKTYWAEITAKELSARTIFNKTFIDLSQEQKSFILGNDQDSCGTVRICCFHPSYGYEDFIEGYRPGLVNDQIRFSLCDGIFKKLCKDASNKPEHKFFLIIDEINRGDIPRIFGELLTILEKNKRTKTILLPLSGDTLKIPENIYIIGTMNTADRSIALLDTALRRRFGFIELLPDSSIFGNTVIEGIPLGPWFDSLNKRICDNIGKDARNLQIGHSYFLEGESPVNDIVKFIRILKEDIIPLLQEYCYEDYSILEKILGKEIIDLNNLRIRNELFDESKQDELIQSLLEPCPEIISSPQALTFDSERMEKNAENNGEEQ